MALSTYAELQSSVSSWLHRDDLASVIPDFITLAETEIFRRLRTFDNETTFSSTMATDGTLALPSSYIDLKFAYINTVPVQSLSRKTNSWIYQNYPTRAATSKPVTIAREGSSFIFGPFPDSQYLVTGVYYKNTGPLSSSVTPTIFTSNPDCYLYGSLLASAPFLKNDNRVPMWQMKYDVAMLSAQVKSDREMVSGSDLRMTPG